MLFWDNGKENGNYCSTLVLFWENGKENGNYCGILHFGIMKKKMEILVVYLGYLGKRFRA